MPLKVVPQRDRKLYRLVKRGEPRVLKRGENLFLPGDPARELYLVRRGHLRLAQAGREGRERVVSVVGPWELGGEKGLLPGTPRDCRAYAGEECRLILLEGAGARRALQTSETSFEAFLRAKEGEIALARALSGLRRPGGSRARLGLLLLSLAARMGRFDEEGTRLPVRLTHQLLADLSASHRSTVTTLLNDWIYQGAVDETEGFLRILDPGALSPEQGPLPGGCFR